MDGAERPVVGGERPHLVVTVPVEALVQASEERSAADPAQPMDSVPELDHVGPVGPEVVRRLACDAQVRRVVLSGRSEPLDVGRRTPVISPAMRRALIVRDGGCRFPGCDRPPSWCDGHHVVPWAEGGPTALANLLLLCRRHHRLVHRRGGFTLALEDGRPVFRRPDGSVLEEVRAPP
ncbi:MAG TPA: HNH endonuclease [Actinomycetota bacterium]|nr:HNH endonuclease [Actinomycetota bacterium]